MGGIDETSIGQWKQFGLQGIEKQTAEIRGGPTESGAKIGTANIADEESVAGEDGERHGFTLCEIEDKKRNGLGRVARSFESFKTHAAKFDDGAIGKRSEAIFRLGFGA